MCTWLCTQLRNYFQASFLWITKEVSFKKSFYNFHPVQKDRKVVLTQEGQAWKGVWSRSGWESKELLCLDSSSIHTPASLKRNNYYHLEKTPTCHPGLLSVSILTPDGKDYDVISSASCAFTRKHATHMDQK